MRGQLFHSVAHCAMIAMAGAIGSAAYGQTATTAPTTQDTNTTSNGVQDIVVTAQRVGENLQKVPIAISAVNASMAEAMGIKGSQDVSIAAPAVTFAETSSGANITVRGVGGSGSSVDEAANAVYIDGVYQAAAPALAFSLNNIERIEVAKGPQGTLFGRNSTGGVIQIITRDPPTRPTADMSITYGNYRTVETQAYVGGGLAPHLSGDVALFYGNQDKGWGTNLYNGEDAYAGRNFVGRGKLKWQDDSTKIVLTLMRSDLRPATSQGGNILPGETTRSAGGVSGVPNLGFYDIDQNHESSKHVRQNQASLNIEHDFTAFRLVNIAAYTKTKLDFLQDVDIGPADIVDVNIHNPIRTISEELQLLSPTGSWLKWSVGFFYFKNDVKLTPYTVTGLSQGAPGHFTTINAGSFTTSYAGYGQATAPILKDTNLTIGLRYTADDRRLAATITNQNGSGAPIAASKVDTKLTWRFSLDHQFTPDLLGYISYNRGYKSGLYNIAAPTQPSVDPETVDAYEAGIKAKLFNNAVRLNISGFYYDFTNIQVRTTNSTGATILLNAASAHIKGADIDLTASPIHGLTIQGALSYLDTAYRGFGNAPFYTVLPTGGLAQAPGDASGRDLIFSPKWVASLGTNYKIPTAIGDFGLSGTVYYNGGFYFDPQNRVRQDSYALVNGSLSWSPNNSGLEVRLWARNLTSKKYIVSATSATVGDEYYPGAPRTYGMTLRYRFQ